MNNLKNAPKSSQGMDEETQLLITLPGLILSQTQLNYKLSNVEENINFILSKLTKDKFRGDPDSIKDTEMDIKGDDPMGILNDLSDRINSANYRADEIKSTIQLIKNLL
jgi:hypothetical protein